VTFDARIRWQGPDPTIEIETRHSGFPTPEDAALFANAIPPGSPANLQFESERIEIYDDAGTPLARGPTEITVWVLSESVQDGDVVEDADFAPYDGPLAMLAQTASGTYQPAQYGVIDAAGNPVGVSISLDETGLLGVVVEDPSDDPNDDETAFLLAWPEGS
jgi:hypothetical protein